MQQKHGRACCWGVLTEHTHWRLTLCTAGARNLKVKVVFCLQPNAWGPCLGKLAFGPHPSRLVATGFTQGTEGLSNVGPHSGHPPPGAMAQQTRWCRSPES